MPGAGGRQTVRGPGGVLTMAASLCGVVALADKGLEKPDVYKYSLK